MMGRTDDGKRMSAVRKSKSGRGSRSAEGSAFRRVLLRGIVFAALLAAVTSTGCIWVAVGAGGGAVAGAAAADEDRDAGDVITDAALVTRVKAALVAAKDVSATRVKVYAHLGVITLKGYVRSEDEARRAMAAAKKVRGVKKVVAKMTIDSD